jgi:glycosyltransferase involved in cell wall biosynthesis
MISFIIPAHNEEALLEQTLKALTRAAEAVGEPYEIIVVDDASTDRTAEIAVSYGAEVVSIDRRQIAAARNAGAAVARGDVFIFVDADTIVGEAPLRGAIAALRGGAAGGGAPIRLDEPTPWWVRLLVERMFMLLYRVGRFASGSFLFCSRRAFDAAGGFDEELYAAEELSMSRALRRHGRFVLLRDRVITSGRKIRSYSTGELLVMTFQIIVGGKRGLRDPNRRAMRVWYGPRRADDPPGNRL